jgi:glycosyltransferase involved in cell wall biosynthesis
LKILIAHSRYRHIGGEERNVELLIRGLTERGMDVRLLELSSAELRSALSRIAAGAGMVYRPSSARAVREQTAAWKPDVVHVHNLLPLLSPSVLRESKRLGAAVVLTAHNHRLFCPAGTLTRRGRVHHDCVRGSSFLCGARGARSNYAESLLYGAVIEVHRRLHLVDRWVDRYVTPSTYLRDILASTGMVRRSDDRIAVVPNGVRIPSRVAERRDHGLFAGRLSAEKGLGTLLAAAALVPEVPLVVAGDGPLAGAVDGGSLPNLRRVGHLSQEELETLRASAAFTVIPSECPESQPYAALESLASGVPLVATRVGGLAELAGDADSLLVEEKDPRGLAAAMEQAWASANSKPAWGEDARRVAVERYSLETHISSILGVYENVLRSS